MGSCEGQNVRKNYSVTNFEVGKQQNKEILCTLFNLDPTKPLLYRQAVRRKRRFVTACYCFVNVRELSGSIILGSGTRN
jgi:hypothetical protein